MTQTTIVAPTLPPCPSQPFCGCGDFPDAGVAFSAAAADAAAGAVNIISQSVVGPYDTVQLQSTDPMALDTWLQANGYTIPAAVQPIVAQYVSEGFDFLALRLAPGQGVQAMRPVSVTSTGAGLSLPLRMVAAGTGATVGITLWVVATGGYEPQNFQTFTISAASLVWDWSQGISNYSTLVSQKETALGNAAWQIESALDESPFQVENLVLQGNASNDYLPAPATNGEVGEAGLPRPVSATAVRAKPRRRCARRTSRRVSRGLARACASRECAPTLRKPLWPTTSYSRRLRTKARCRTSTRSRNR